MGNSLENVRKNTENAKEFETKALERGESVVEEVKEAEGILEGVKGLDVEQDILSAVEATTDAVKGDGTDHMKSEVHESLDDGSEKVDEVTDESQEQVELNNEAVSELDSIKDYGSEAAESAKETAEDMSENFEDYQETAESDLEESEEEHERQIDEIMG